MSELPASLCADSRYMAMRIQRVSLGPGGAANAERFKRECAARGQE